MNTIDIVNGKIISNILDSIEINVDENTSFLNVNKLEIIIKENTSLIINHNSKNLEKWNIIFRVLPNVNFNLFELQETKESKIQYTYYLEENANTFVFRFNHLETIKERTFIYLDGDNAKIDYHLKTISTNLEEYDHIIYHNGNATESSLSLNGVNIKKGVLEFNITGEVQSGKVDCIINEESRIVNLTNNSCTIKPNLLVDEYSVSANHSALIGPFSDDELFYLQSRGISKELATSMLIKGFLLNDLGEFTYKKELLEKIINKYWR